MSAGGDFGDRVLVTSSATRVDTDVLVGAAVRVAGAAAEVGGVLTLLDATTERCRDHAPLAPVEAAVALTEVEGARATVEALGRRLVSLAESLSFAALVYLGAEGRASAFRDAWALLHPGGRPAWRTGVGSVHSREALRDLLPAGVSDHLPGALLDWVLAPVLPFLLGVGTSAAGHAAAATGEGDMTTGIRLQMDLHAASELVADHTLATGRDAGPGSGGAWGVPGRGRRTGAGPDDGAGPSWWGTPDGATPEAASLAAAWGFGLGRLTSSPTRGVQVTSAVPVDTLDMRTGRPVGVGPRHHVVDSDVAARRFGVDLTPLNLGILGLPSLVGSTLGAIPVRQGGPALEHAPAASPQHRVETPRQPSQVLSRIGHLRSSPAAGQVEVLRHRTPGVEGEVTSWSVVIRGTQAWGVGGPNPQDMLSNLQVVAGEHSDQARAVLAAMEMAGVTAGQTVELVGHSQGGAVAAQLASDPEVLARYSVTSVLTAGSPTAGAAPAEGVEMLNLENTRDMVPGLDGAANRDLGAARTVHFDGGAMGGRTSDEDMSAGGPDAREEAPGAHDLRTYRRVMEWLEERGESGERGEEDVPTGYEEVRSWMQERERTLGFGEGTRTTSHVFDTRRLGVGS